MNVSESKRSRWLGPTLAFGMFALICGGFFWYHRASSSRESLLSQSRQAMRLGDYATAELLVEELLTDSPDDPELLLMLAENYLAREETERTLEVLERYPDAGEKVESVRLQQARLLLQINRPTAAEKVLSQSIVQFPQSIPMQQLLLDILSIQDRKAESFGLLTSLAKQAESRATIDRIWVLAKEFDLHFGERDIGVIWPILQGFELNEPDGVPTFLAMARVRLGYGEQLEPTLQRLNTLLADEKFGEQATMILLEHLIERSGEEEKIDLLLKGWTAKRHKADKFRLAGRWHLRNDRLAEADRAFVETLTLEPWDWQTMHQLGTLRIRLARQAGNEADISNGTKLIDLSVRIRETFKVARKTVEFLRQWFVDPRPTLDAEQRAKLSEIAKINAEAQFWDQARRWMRVSDEVTRKNESAEFDADLENRKAGFTRLLSR